VALPFTEAQFFGVFAAYNAAVWPAQVALHVLALLAVGLAAARAKGQPLVAAILALLWAWTGLAYHWIHFRPVTPAAGLFAGLSLAQGALLGWAATRGTLRFAAREMWRRALGWSLVAYALVVYPLWGWAAGHPVRELPVLGVPCPTTILTLGLLFWAAGGPPRYLLPIPLLWSAIGGSAAFALGVPQDLGLLAAGLLGLALLRRQRPGRESSLG
jgi:hypothetical protein